MLKNNTMFYSRSRSCKAGFPELLLNTPIEEIKKAMAPSTIFSKNYSYICQNFFFCSSSSTPKNLG